MLWHRCGSERLFLFQAHATAFCVGRPEMEKTDPNLALALALDLLDYPSGAWLPGIQRPSRLTSKSTGSPSGLTFAPG
jgi:hypothetical protein